MVRAWLMASVLVLVAAPGLADCVDINADPAERLITIAHINDDRAMQLIAGRSWPSVSSLTGINGVDRGRIQDILKQSTYHHVSKKHAQRYIASFAWRFNRRYQIDTMTERLM